jgi:5-methylcytosine-specific restriction endonuclease McrA
MQFIPKNSYQDLPDAELLRLTLRAAKTEKEASLALLDYLVEVDERRLYATVNACSSLFDYLVRELGFSHPAASERVNAVRLIRAVPPVKEHLETGKLTLTSAAQIQRFVNAEQKVHPQGKAVSSEEKEKVVEACLGKSKREVGKTLFEKQSEPARALTQEKIRPLNSTRSEIKFSVNEETLNKLHQLKDLIGNPSLKEIFDQALDAFLLVEKKKRGVISTQSKVTKAKSKVRAEKTVASIAVQGQPAESARLKNRTATQLNSRFIPIDLKRFVFARSNGRCEFIDPRTKTRCASTFRLQIDHILPMALGGKTETANLRHLCSAHNLRMAVGAGLHRPNEAAKHC